MGRKESNQTSKTKQLYCLGKENCLLYFKFLAECFVTVNDLWLILTVLWVALQCVILVFPDHTHLLILHFYDVWYMYESYFSTPYS